MRRACVLLSLGLVGCASSFPTQVSSRAELEAVIAARVDARSPPGMAMVVAKNGRVVYRRGFGVADARGRAMSPDCVFQWWSITKIATVVAIMQLVEADALRLDDPVSKYLPYFQVHYDGVPKSPTLRQLLSHSAGLGDAGLRLLDWIHYDGEPPKNQVEFMRAQLPHFSDLDFEPGSEGRYTNVGYLALAAVIEAVSGESYASYVSRRILKPLGMTHTDLIYTPTMRRHEAVGTHPDDLLGWVVLQLVDRDKLVREKRDGRFWFHHVYADQNGATGVIGSPDDLARFGMMLLGGGEFEGTRILKPESVRKMMEPQVPVTDTPMGDHGEGTKFALGWFRTEKDGRLALSHGGSGPGFVTMLRLFPEENLAIVLMANDTYFDDAWGANIVEAASSVPWGDAPARAPDPGPAASAP